MSVFKSGKIGYNETYFGEWARNVLNEVKARKVDETSEKNNIASTSIFSRCTCS
jgi:hypothetical protein